MHRQTQLNAHSVLVLVAITLGSFGCSSSSPTPSNTGAVGGATSSGGSIGSSGGSLGTTGGSKAAGGMSSTGGSNATGGMTPVGGATANGGATTAGGMMATGGATTAGGAPSTGGAMATGGSFASGGATTAGGTTATGGSQTTGGVPATGGTTATAGATATGGMSATGGSSAGEYGFTYRKPPTVTVACPDQSRDMLAQDWLCTFHEAGVSGYIYVQSNITGTSCKMDFPIPLYTTALAQISINGQVTNLGSTQYDAGGVHGNDFITLNYLGRTYEYRHSSFFVQLYKCQPMDCVLIYAAGSTLTVETNGCTSARTLPEVCVAIKADGTHDPLSPDPFEPCQ